MLKYQMPKIGGGLSYYSIDGYVGSYVVHSSYSKGPAYNWFPSVMYLSDYNKRHRVALRIAL
jgi:hypothetical protein